MCKKTFYVGIDVGQEELWVAMEGKKARSFPHTLSGIKQMHGWVSRTNKDGLFHFCMEATGVYSQSLAACLLELPQTQVSIVNPAQIAYYAKAQLRRTKTDRVDSGVILSFAKSQNPPLWKPPSEALQRLYQLVVQADALKAELGSWRNRAHTHGYTPHLPEIVVQSTKSIRRFLERELDKLEREIGRLCQEKAELSAQMELLISIPGIAHLTASRLLAYGGSYLGSLSARAMVAYAGLAPRERQSGTSVHGKSRLGKQGNARLRHTLYMPTLCALNHNPLIRAFYQRLLAHGKLKMVAVAACMKKLLLIAKAVLVTQKPFNPGKLHLT